MTKDDSLSFLDKNPVLRNKEFLCLLLFRFGIFFVLNLQSTALYFWVYQITGSNLKMGLIGLAEVIPAILFSLISGYIVDMREKKKMLLICAIGYVCLGGGLSLLSTNTSLNHLGLNWTLNCIFSLIFLGGVLRAFLAPSLFALLGVVIPREHYTNATSWSSLAFKIGTVLGPLSFGVIDALMSLIIKRNSPVTAGVVRAIPAVTGSMCFIFFMELILIVLVILVKARPFVKKEKKKP